MSKPLRGLIESIAYSSLRSIAHEADAICNCGEHPYTDCNQCPTCFAAGALEVLDYFLEARAQQDANQSAPEGITRQPASSRLPIQPQPLTE